MRAVVIADDDSLVGALEEPRANLLISLGDIWDSTIEKAQVAYGCPRVLAVKGNHDSGGAFPSNVENLHFSVSEYRDVLFGGFGGSWRYKPRGHHLYEQEEVSSALRSFPSVDVFVAHNSPRGIHERDSDVHQGFDGFLEYIDRVQPRYFLHGHQHVNQTTERGGTTIIGVFGEAVLDLTTGDNKALDPSES